MKKNYYNFDNIVDPFFLDIELKHKTQVKYLWAFLRQVSQIYNNGFQSRLEGWPFQLR